MTGKRIGYIRVSSEDQNVARQLDGITLDKTFIDYVSGKSTDRYQLKQLLEFVREDDVVYCHSMDRMARNVRDLHNLVDTFTSQKVEIHFIKENLIFNGRDDAMSRLMLSIMGAVAEFELARIKERQAEGIKIAKVAGKYKGRRKALTPEKMEHIKEEYYGTRKTITQIAFDLNVSRPTVYKFIKELKDQGQDVPKFIELNPVTVDLAQTIYPVTSEISEWRNDG